MDAVLVRSLLAESLLAYELKDVQLDQLVDYLALLVKWNKTYNLTAIRDPLEMVKLHLIDSLAVLPYVKDRVGSGALLDVGAGAGLPSIPLAICLPEVQVYAIDKVQKKTSFMQQVKAELKLANFNVRHGRVERLNQNDFGGDGLSIIISRAFSEIALFVSLTKHLLNQQGCWLAMKGVAPTAELDALSKQGKYLATVYPLAVEQLAAERHLVEIKLGGKISNRHG